MRLPVLVFAILASGTCSAFGQDGHSRGIALACANPRAVRALNNPADPRRADRNWIRFVISDGRCVSLPDGTALIKISEDIDLSLVRLKFPGVADPLYVRSTDLVLDAPAAAPDLPQSAPPAPWQASRPLGGVITCQLEGDTSAGHAVLSVTADHAGIAQLRLQKKSWHIPTGTPVSIIMDFSEGTSVSLGGAGNGSEVAFSLVTGTLKPWVHGFTAGKTASVRFPGGNEPPWTMTLQGTSAAITSMAACIKDAELLAPPPLGEVATQPFSQADVPRAPEVMQSPILAPVIDPVPVYHPTPAPVTAPAPLPPSSAEPEAPAATSSPAPQQPLPSYSSSSTETRQDSTETNFISAVEQAASAYASAPNDMLKGAARAQRAAAVCSILQRGRANDWRGRIVTLSSNGDGKGVLAIAIDRKITVKTWSNSFSDIGDHTLIPPSSPLFQAAAHLAEGARVIFSGEFLPNDVDCVKEASLTLDGSMTGPDYIMRFTDIRPDPSR